MLFGLVLVYSRKPKEAALASGLPQSWLTGMIFGLVLMYLFDAFLFFWMPLPQKRGILDVRKQGANAVHQQGACGGEGALTTGGDIGVGSSIFFSKHAPTPAGH